MSKYVDLFLAVWAVLIGTGLLPFAIKLMIANTKNKNLLMFETWALQGVQYAQKNADSNEAKKQEAISFLAKRLQANKLGAKFSDAQLEAAIEIAVAKLHDMTATEQVKPKVVVPAQVVAEPSPVEIETAPAPEAENK